MVHRPTVTHCSSPYTIDDAATMPRQKGLLTCASFPPGIGSRTVLGLVRCFAERAARGHGGGTLPAFSARPHLGGSRRGFPCRSAAVSGRIGTSHSQIL